MSSCDLCEAAIVNPRLDAFSGSCLSCSARALACVTLEPETEDDKDAIAQAWNTGKLFGGIDRVHGLELTLAWHKRIRAFTARKAIEDPPVDGSVTSRA